MKNLKMFIFGIYPKSSIPEYSSELRTFALIIKSEVFSESSFKVIDLIAFYGYLFSIISPSTLIFDESNFSSLLTEICDGNI